jgi:anti-sigma factor RsiW
MHCKRYRDNVGPLIDGEISPEERSATIAHLNGCPACAAEYQRLQDMRRRLLVARVPMPRSLVHRVRARIAREAAELEHRPQSAPMAQTLVPSSSRFDRVRPWLRQAAVILVACGISAAAALSWSRTATEREMITHDIVSAHVRGLLQGNPVQVASLDTHTVKPWFAGRLEFTPVVKDLDAAGFHLTGGRLDYVGGRRVAVLIYTRRLHQISVFIWPGAGEEAPMMAAPNGFNVVSWSHAGMSFWAISDLSELELKELPPLL